MKGSAIGKVVQVTAEKRRTFTFDTETHPLAGIGPSVELANWRDVLPTVEDVWRRVLNSGTPQGVKPVRS